MIRPVKISSNLLKPPPAPLGYAAYLINLVRRPDRLAVALAEFSKQTSFAPTIWPAVDGQQCEVPEGWPNAGAFGCNRSHVAVLSDAVAKGHETIAVFEDDVVFCHEFDRRLAGFLQVCPEWDAVFLGGQWMGPAQQIGNGVLRVVSDQGIHRTHAYLIRGEYLRFMLSEWESKPGHIDHVWGRSQKDWRVYAPEHSFAAQAAGRSDINGRHNPEKWWTHRRIQPQHTPTPPVQPRPVQPAPPSEDGCSPCERLRKLRQQLGGRG